MERLRIKPPLKQQSCEMIEEIVDFHTLGQDVMCNAQVAPLLAMSVF